MIHLVARALVASIFLLSGAGKIFNFAGTATMMAGVGFPAPELFLVGAILLEVVGGLALLVGWQTKWAAAALIVFLIPATLVFHVPNIAEQAEMISTLKNIAILGALLKFWLEGAGEWAVDSFGARAKEARVAH